MAVVTVMAAEVRLELREGGALFATLADLTLWHLRNTHQPAVVSAVVEEQLLVRVDLCGCTEEQFTIGRIGHQILLFTGPRLSDKHHPVAFILICSHNVELQHVVVVHLPYLRCVFFEPIREIHIATVLSHHWSEAGPRRNDVPCKNSKRFVGHRDAQAQRARQRESSPALDGRIRDEGDWAVFWTV